MSSLQSAKIAISGPFSSGKTTLFRALSDRFPQLQPYPEIASAAKLAFPGLDWRRDDVRGYLRWAQIIAERTCETKGGVGLFDGTYIDVVAHERVFGTGLTALTPEHDPRHYDVVLLCAADGVPLEDNGIRETDATLRMEIEVLLHEEARRRSSRVIILTGPFEARLASAAREVEAILAKFET